MAKDRLKRLLVVLLLVGFLAIGVKVMADWQVKKKSLGQETSLSVSKIGEKISDLGENVLGKAVEVLPVNKELKEKVISVESQSSENDASGQTTTQTEKVEIKTQEIIEIIKELPAEQLENIKKQVFKDFCQSILEEE